MFLPKKTKIEFNIFPKIKRHLLKKETPGFYTDIKIIKKRYQQLQKQLQKNWSGKNIIAFSFKTNYEIVEEMKKNINISAEIVSAMEYKMAKNFKFTNSKIIYNGPYKKNLQNVINKKNITINLDNQTELNKVIKIKNKIKSNIGLRLNTNLKTSHFGFNIESGDAKKAINRLQKNHIKISGLHIHLGFYSPPSTYKQISQKIVNLIKENNLELKYIDFGGGFPSHGQKPYKFKKDVISSIEDYITQICYPLNRFFKKQEIKPIIIIEPGRFLVDDSTVFITKVIHNQLTKKKQIIIVNATNQMLSSVWFRPQIIKLLKKQNNKEINTIVYGSSCQEDDVLYQGKLPLIQKNILIAFYCVGAYNQNMSNNFIFQKPKHYFL